jgi:hypothetical protein
MLTRKHAADIVNLRKIVDYDLVLAWSSVFAPEEVTARNFS